MVKNGILCLFFTKNVLPLSSLKAMPFQPVPWMSGLVSGLQNRVRRFESARYLKEAESKVILARSHFFGDFSVFACKFEKISFL